MKLAPLSALPLIALLSATAIGCAADTEAGDASEDDSAFSSNQATLMDFEFQGELLTKDSWSARSEIDSQMLYTIGHLNTNKSVARLDKLTLTDVVTTDVEGGLQKITYKAKIPVAWASKRNLPRTYELVMPKRSDSEGLEAFTEKYKTKCVEAGAHDVDSGSLWYYYRPLRSGCRLDAGDVVRFQATATRSAENSSGKYPEYNKVWEDKELNVVAIFGKYEDGARDRYDAGISAYFNFVRATSRELGTTATVTPALPASDPSELPEGEAFRSVKFEKQIDADHKVNITAILVDNVRTTAPEFTDLYNQLSGSADLIAYNGHAGLGQNVRALANRGRFKAGQYQIFFMNGCDTFAYVDGSLAQSRARLNPDDPTGTKYMEIVTNAMPSFFSSMPNASMSLVRGLLSYSRPKTYDQMFTSVDNSQVIVVTGEEDNTYRP